MRTKRNQYFPAKFAGKEQQNNSVAKTKFSILNRWMEQVTDFSRFAKTHTDYDPAYYQDSTKHSRDIALYELLDSDIFIHRRLKWKKCTHCCNYSDLIKHIITSCTVTRKHRENLYLIDNLDLSFSAELTKMSKTCLTRRCTGFICEIICRTSSMR